ncbi:tetratricopeptide repeat protein [Nonomuraea wenchangensis]|uniref:tetratricopeptide repeat protein n=1 Tax=Nonomuraea wenchangensis TaxID=568860 RepID=UPI003331CC41
MSEQEEMGPSTASPVINLMATASGQGRVYQAGRDQTFHQAILQAEALRPVDQVVAPPHLVNVPAQAQVFVSRDRELAALDQGLAGTRAVVVVHGLGGIGKSTLAARYAAARAQAGINPVWWITADTPGAIEAGLAALAAGLQPELRAAAPLPVLAERATAWLAAHAGWLLVLDDVADPGDVRPLLERISAGQVLVTSRLAEGWHRLGANELRLDVLDEQEAIELLAGISADGQPSADGAAELVRELGYLPLAVKQAAAYLHQARLSPRAYLGLLREQPAVMYDRTARGADAERTIARIWRLTLDRLADTPSAGQLLRVLAWYGAEPLPRTLLDSPDTDTPDVRHALDELAAYNMITLDGAAVIVHPLVQAVVRSFPDLFPGADITNGLRRATELLDKAIPPVYAPVQWPIWRMLVPHIAALAQHAQPETDSNITAHLFNQTGLFFMSQGAFALSIRYHQRALTAYARILTSDHPDTLTSRNNLASAYQSAGDLGRAIPLFEATLAERERVLGADHPDALASRNNLASAYQSAGDLGRAIPLFEATLAERERVLGADHPGTLTSRNNLAYAYESAGDLGRAIPLFEATLAERERVLGADHPDTLASRNNLASAYQSAGDLGRAIPLYEQTLADRERVLGGDHPDTLASRNNLAYAYESAGDLRRAIPLYERTLAERERVLGADHPDTLTSRNNLAYAYRAAGDLGRAISLSERTLEDCERVLGIDHPDTLASRNNLAGAYMSAGDLGRAIPLYEQTLADMERVLGAGHPSTLTSRNNLAGAYMSAGDLGRAIPLYEQTLADAERVLGLDHPLTKAVQANLSSIG